MNSRSKKRVVVGISGGVDSSIAAYLLKEQGYDVIGLFMKNWEEDDQDGYCASAEDLQDASEVCETLGIPLETINFSHEYWERVFEHFLAEYRAYRTPNPDVLCNKEIKFKEFLGQAKVLGASNIATGHYAQISEYNGIYQLRRAVDQNKDQSYFLHLLDQDALAQSIFPIGHLLKSEVRALANQLGLCTSSKKDSTGICFIGERKFKNFLSSYLPAQPGKIVDDSGRCLGQHDGLMYYTIGQRHGLGIGGPGEAWYVSGKNVKQNRLEIVQGHDHPRLMSAALTATSLHWISCIQPKLPFLCTAKTRYRQQDEACNLSRIDGDLATVEFQDPQRAITPGQSVVFYRDQTCLGGGIIQEALNIEGRHSPVTATASG